MGIDKEAVAIAKYEACSGVAVKKCGLVISPKWPWLGCSPDGLIMDAVQMAWKKCEKILNNFVLNMKIS